MVLRQHVPVCHTLPCSDYPPVRREVASLAREVAGNFKKFERRLRALQQAGEITDPREAQIERLKSEITKLKARLTRSDSAIEELTDFRTQALARLAAQHEEILHLRKSAAAADRVTRLPTARSTSIGSCS
ncbi:hypothetical protein PUR49_02145 [Streptomyces sp. BE147]|nr:hypothetical protein [Streptomyces sp. BE147]MEE1735340.1 hypothetical protein [Streptomyces sp. BE147]